MKVRLGWICFLMLVASAVWAPASASCTLPYTLTNGQTADASQVMANLNAIIGCLGSTTGGFVNKFRNGTMDVWQRGTSGTSTTTAGPTTQTAADGWYVVPTGANVTWNQVAGREPTVYSLKITGASSVTDVLVKQRIESSIAAPLAGQIVTVQAQIYNSTGNTVTPTLTVKHAGSADNWSSPVTDVSAVSLQSTPNSQWTQVAYTFSANAASSNGLEISFDFGNNFSGSGQSIQITELDIRSTPGVATGVNNTPPAPELRPIGSEMPFNLRYLFAINEGGNDTQVPVFGSYSGAASAILGQVQFPVPMRAAPSFAAVSVGSFKFLDLATLHLVTGTLTVQTQNSPSIYNCLLYITSTGSFSAGDMVIMYSGGGSGQLLLSAEL